MATDAIVENTKAWLAFMLSYELKLEAVPESETRTSFLIVLGSTVFGSLITYFFMGGGLVASAFGSVVMAMDSSSSPGTTSKDHWRFIVEKRTSNDGHRAGGRGRRLPDRGTSLARSHGTRRTGRPYIDC